MFVTFQDNQLCNVVFSLMIIKMLANAAFELAKSFELEQISPYANYINLWLLSEKIVVLNIFRTLLPYIYMRVSLFSVATVGVKT